MPTTTKNCCKFMAYIFNKFFASLRPLYTHIYILAMKLWLYVPLTQNELNMLQHFRATQLRNPSRSNFQATDETRMLPAAYLIHKAKMSAFCVFVQKRCLGKLCGKWVKIIYANKTGNFRTRTFTWNLLFVSGI